jgi:hypothetical protein
MVILSNNLAEIVRYIKRAGVAQPDPPTPILTCPGNRIESGMGDWRSGVDDSRRISGECCVVPQTMGVLSKNLAEIVVRYIKPGVGKPDPHSN